MIEFEQNHNRMLPFTYLFKGVNEYEQGNYVQSIEHFQNATQFYNLHQNEIKNKNIQLTKPNYPLVEDSVIHLNIQGPLSQMYGIYGKHKYTVTPWQYSTQCYHQIRRYTSALKCLMETFNQLSATLVGEDGENCLDY